MAYDSLMREDYSYVAYAGYIKKAFTKYGGPRGGPIADLGCGAGAMCVELAKQGYDAIGIDNSPHMLARARDAAISGGYPDMLFLEQDITSFELIGKAGAFISTIDSVNYITDKRGFRRVFRLAASYLPPGGLFIFDINTEHKLKNTMGGNIFYNIGEDFCCLWESRFGAGKKISVSELTLFTRSDGDRWRRYDETHRQRAYSAADIEAALDGSGFTIIGTYGFLSFRKPAPDADKISYILMKQ